MLSIVGYINLWNDKIAFIGMILHFLRCYYITEEAMIDLQCVRMENSRILVTDLHLYKEFQVELTTMCFV